jgi:hypothetical protein
MNHDGVQYGVYFNSCDLAPAHHDSATDCHPTCPCNLPTALGNELILLRTFNRASEGAAVESRHRMLMKGIPHLSLSCLAFRHSMAAGYPGHAYLVVAATARNGATLVQPRV